MNYFTQDFIDFLRELENNNHKEWFDENRKRYHKSVKEPFENYVNAVITEVNKIDSRVEIPHKHAIFRINRDIRFSKDKTPYKTTRSGIVSVTGTKNKKCPGLYFEMGTEFVKFYGGAFMLDAKELLRVREDIADYSEDFDKIITNKKFLKTFQEVSGQKGARIPKELKEAAEKQPLIFNKNFYVFAKYPVETILNDDLLEVTMEHYKTVKPFNDFLERSVMGIDE